MPIVSPEPFKPKQSNVHKKALTTTKHFKGYIITYVIINSPDPRGLHVPCRLCILVNYEYHGTTWYPEQMFEELIVPQRESTLQLLLINWLLGRCITDIVRHRLRYTKSTSSGQRSHIGKIKN